MKTMKELRESLNKTGTYASVKLSQQSKTALFDYVKFLGIPNTIDPNEYHATVIYSRKEIPRAYDYNNFEVSQSEHRLLATAKEWKVFPSKEMGHCLVLALDFPSAVDYHNHFMDMGATYDYLEYIPHITIATNYTDAIIPTNLPPFTLKFDKLVVEPLDLNYSYIKDKS